MGETRSLEAEEERRIRREAVAEDLEVEGKRLVVAEIRSQHGRQVRTKRRGNIARGTTDPEIDSETWTELGNNMAPLALIANLAIRWRHLTFSHYITFSH